MIDGHGDDLFRFGSKIKHNFSSNIFNQVDHTGLLEHLASCADSILHYPEPRCRLLEAVLAHQAGVSPENLLVTGGATECIYMIAQMLHGKNAAIVAPAFREYEDACLLNSLHVVWSATLEEALATHPHVVWVCNPANPTGRVTPLPSLLAAISAHPTTLFVVDQAYADYTSLPLLPPAQCVESRNVIILSSLTKRFAVPGLRIGYAIGRVGEVARYLKPWSVSSVAVSAAHYLLAHPEQYPINAPLLHHEALRISRQLQAIGIEVLPTDCNFMLCALPSGTAASLKQWLVDTHGILIRDASNFHGLSERHFRIAAQTPLENDLLIKALGQWIHS